MDALPDRLKKKIEVRGSCWVWTAALTSKGYGHVTYKYKTYRAHRLIYELLVGPIPAGLTLDHLCRVRACVNPAHLEPVTNQVNLLRGDTLPARNAVKTHCDSGHPFSKENTRLYQGHRQCRVCQSAEGRRQRERNAS